MLRGTCLCTGHAPGPRTNVRGDAIPSSFHPRPSSAQQPSCSAPCKASPPRKKECPLAPAPGIMIVLLSLLRVALQHRTPRDDGMRLISSLVHWPAFTPTVGALTGTLSGLIRGALRIEKSGHLFQCFAGELPELGDYNRRVPNTSSGAFPGARMHRLTCLIRPRNTRRSVKW